MCNERKPHMHYLPILTADNEEYVVIEDTESSEEFRDNIQKLTDRAREDVRLLPDGPWKFAVERLIDIWDLTAQFCYHLSGNPVDETDEEILGNMPTAIATTIQKFSQNAMARDFVLPSLTIN